MIILDTNVVSEVMRPLPDVRVVEWLDARLLSGMATTTISVAEIRYGLARLSFGSRRSDLETRFESFVARAFGERVLGFDRPAANAYGELIVNREGMGRPLEGFDGLIAAIALAGGHAIATRNTRDFDGCGVPVISPWG